MTANEIEFVEVAQGGQTVTLEYTWLGAPASDVPILVFLHEGLGSVAMWRDFPARLCAEGGFRGLVYSRYGYGRSTPRPRHDRAQTIFMHDEARVVLPQVLGALNIKRPWLFGHSDGASIALLYASLYPEAVSGLVVLAPHVFVETGGLAHIARTKERYETGDLRVRLARYHDVPDSAFLGWSDIWLDPRFRAWNIEAALTDIRCRVLAVQGEDDEYGTLAQVEAIKRVLPQTTLAIFARCGHSPQRDQPQALIAATVRFIRGDLHTPM